MYKRFLILFLLAAFFIPSKAVSMSVAPQFKELLDILDDHDIESFYQDKVLNKMQDPILKIQDTRINTLDRFILATKMKSDRDLSDPEIDLLKRAWNKALESKQTLLQDIRMVIDYLMEYTEHKRGDTAFEYGLKKRITDAINRALEKGYVLDQAIAALEAYSSSKTFNGRVGVQYWQYMFFEKVWKDLESTYNLKKAVEADRQKQKNKK